MELQTIIGCVWKSISKRCNPWILSWKWSHRIKNRRIWFTCLDTYRFVWYLRQRRVIWSHSIVRIGFRDASPQIDLPLMSLLTRIPRTMTVWWTAVESVCLARVWWRWPLMRLTYSNSWAMARMWEIDRVLESYSLDLRRPQLFDLNSNWYSWTVSLHRVKIWSRVVNSMDCERWRCHSNCWTQCRLDWRCRTSRTLVAQAVSLFALNFL